MHQISAPHIENIIYRHGSRKGAYSPAFRALRKGMVLMYVTYSDLFAFVMVLVAVATLVAHLNDKHKK